MNTASVTATIDVEKRMVNLFIVECEWDSENRKPLVDIATGHVAHLKFVMIEWLQAEWINIA